MNIRDLARHLNISIGTVSRALNGRTDVSAETRRRVLDAARDLNYVPNQSGRSLRQGTTGFIAAMIPTNEDKPLADTIFVSVLDGLRQYLDDRDLDLMVLICGPDKQAYDYLSRVVQRRLADGILLTDTLRDDPRIDLLTERGIPFVCFGRSGTGGGYSWIDLDVENIADQAVRRLAGFGHTRIALARREGDVNYPFILEAAYRRALEACGIPFNPELVIEQPGTEAGGYRLGEAILAMEEPPTAVILMEDAMAVGLYRRLTEAGVTPGRDLAVIGFQETPSASFLSPKLTCFRGDHRKLGARLGEALMATIPAYRGANPEPPVQMRWPMELVPGESDGFLPATRRIGSRRRD